MLSGFHPKGLMNDEINIVPGQIIAIKIVSGIPFDQFLHDVYNRDGLLLAKLKDRGSPNFKKRRLLQAF
jgi:hypothetical protein